MGNHILTKLLDINIGSFYDFNLAFTHKRKWRNNTSRLNSNKPKKSTHHHIYTRRGRGCHIFKIVRDKTEI